VRVSRSNKYGSNPKEVGEDTSDTKPNSRTNAPQRVPEDFSYSLTFKITPSEAKRFSAFANKNKDGSFQVKIGEHSLGVTQFYWPIEANQGKNLEFTMMLREDNAEKKKKYLRRLRAG
jgi:hypothetical protein